jgi:hypothetical protein
LRAVRQRATEPVTGTRITRATGIVAVTLHKPSLGHLSTPSWSARSVGPTRPATVSRRYEIRAAQRTIHDDRDDRPMSGGSAERSDLFPDPAVHPGNEETYGTHNGPLELLEIAHWMPQPSANAFVSKSRCLVPGRHRLT